MNEPAKLAVFLSGSGTTLQNLIDCIRDGSLPAKIVTVIASKPNLLGIRRAEAAGIPVEVISRKAYANLEAFSEANFATVRTVQAEFVCLAGYLQKLTIPDDFHRRVLNIHPSLLPKFGGKGMYGHHVHEAVLQAGETETGCTVHFVDDEYDHGDIIVQRKVPVLESDTADSLAKRVFTEECLAYPDGIRKVLEL